MVYCGSRNVANTFLRPREKKRMGMARVKELSSVIKGSTFIKIFDCYRKTIVEFVM